MTKIWWVVLACVLGSACNPETPRLEFKHGERRGKLEKNGLRFVIMPDPNTQLVEVDVRYEVGAREDPPGRAGMAHFVEHLMFQQKPDGPATKPLFHFLLQASVFVNAYTIWDQTHYMVNARSEQLDSLLKIEAMRMHYGCETITQEEFEREREVVRNEIRGSMREATGQVYPMTLAAVYPKGHAYHETVGGNDEQIASITLAEACEFMKKYYVPERATIIVAGGIEVDATVASIQKWFGNMERKPAAPRKEVTPIAIRGEKTTIELDLERPMVTVSWALPDATTPKGEAAQFGIWGAFFDTANKALKYECATQVQPAILGGQHAPIFTIFMELKSMSGLDECLGYVWSSAKQVHRGWDAGTWQQLEEVKNRRKAAFISQLEPLTSRTETMGNLVQFTRDFDFDSDGLYLFHELDKIGKFEGEAVASAVKGLLDQDRAKVVVFKPSKAGVKGDRRSKIKFQTKSHEQMEEPEIDPAEAKRPIKVATELKGLDGATRFQLGNGMKVVLLPLDAFPVISAQLIFNVGSAATPDNPLVGALAADFLGNNMEDEATSRTGVSVGCEATPDHTLCNARGMSMYLDVVIKGLERFIRAGEYNQEQIENWQKNIKTAYALKRPQQRLEFSRQQAQAIFGPDHPYTKTGVFMPSYADRIGRDALTSHRNKHYTAGNATLVVVGKFDLKQAESLIRDNFGSWDRGHVDKPISPEPYKRTGAQFIGVIGDDDPQIDIAIMYPMQAGMDGNEGARRVLAEMVNARMWDIRAKLGSTYGTYARRDVRVGPGSYDLGGSVDAPRAGESLKAMRDSLDALRNGEGFDLSFARARRKILQQLLGESTMTLELAYRLGLIARYNLPDKYYNTLLQQVAAVSPAQVRALLKKEFDPANEIIVTLGDRTSTTNMFRDAGISDVKLIEPDYK